MFPDTLVINYSKTNINGPYINDLTGGKARVIHKYMTFLAGPLAKPGQVGFWNAAIPIQAAIASPGSEIVS